MDLSSTTTQAVAVGAAVAATAAVVVSWRALARRGPWAVLARTAALAGVNATVLAAVFLVVNSRFGLYSSWSDLLGVAPATTTTTTSTTTTSTGVLPGHDGRVVSVEVPAPRRGPPAGCSSCCRRATAGSRHPRAATP